MGTRGGARSGAGRKPLPADQKKISVTVKLSPTTVAWMDGQPNSRAVLIERALRSFSAQLDAEHEALEKIMNGSLTTVFFGDPDET